MIADIRKAAGDIHSSIGGDDELSANLLAVANFLSPDPIVAMRNTAGFVEKGIGEHHT